MLAGSVRRGFRGPYDAVLLTNFLHHFDKPTCVVKQGPRGALPGEARRDAEFVPGEDRVSPPMPAAFAMTMLASTAGRRVHTERTERNVHRGGISGLERPTRFQ